MTSNEKMQKRIQRKLKQSDNRMNSLRFFRDYSEGYRYTLCDRNDRDNFVCVMPEGAALDKLLRNKYFHNMSYEMEKTIESTISSLMLFGEAYIYIHPEYKIVKDDDDKMKKVLESLEIHEIRGLLTNRSKENIEFWSVGFAGNVVKNNLDPSCLIKLNLKDIGYSTRHFICMSRKLNKYDITASSSMLVSKVDGYDFSEHMRKNTVQEFKLTRSIGWLSKIDELTDSQILYRKIQQYKFKLQMINYVVDRINDGILKFLGSESKGQLSLRLKNMNCDEVWEEYSTGKITSSELSKLLF